MIPRLHRPALCLLAILPALSLAQQPDPKQPPERIRPEGIDGALVIVGGGKAPPVIHERFMKLAGGDKARLVIIPTASVTADKTPPEKALETWQARKPASVHLLHTRSRKEANDPKFIEPLKTATGVWFGGGDQSKIAEAYLGTAVEKELYALLKRGGVIGGTSAGAAIQSRLMIAGGNPEARTARGFDLLPGAVIDQHFLKRDRKPRLLGVLEKNPGFVGFGIDEGTALVVQGRRIEVIGSSTVTVCLAAGKDRPQRTFELKAGQVEDLTALRRAAQARAGEAFPPKVAPEPIVPKGTLVIVGGGGNPPGLMQKFVELAGGPDALIVVLPTAGEGVPKKPGDAGFGKAGAKNVKVLPARTLAEVEDPRNLEVLKQARGVWFGGGRQWKFVDAYAGTKAEGLFRDVLNRGGVIGGSSAGATIQGDYLCRGSPFGNVAMMYEGYERGLAFLPGVAIDQHFAQRKRFADMTALMKVHPQLLGIGIDEATALVVKGHVADVTGRGAAHFYDYRQAPAAGEQDYTSVKDGGRYDLKARKVLPAP